ncbi:hypothetical protein D1BOALGB6SA_8572 [Olavius sp. associated proteobacterium Delta 1]|nr:hypothetical protein D1BOALGB6SA_8572 [Olavius sp. associated proteobacterium Delta 1]
MRRHLNYLMLRIYFFSCFHVKSTTDIEQYIILIIRRNLLLFLIYHLLTSTKKINFFQFISEMSVLLLISDADIGCYNFYNFVA